MRQRTLIGTAAAVVAAGLVLGWPTWAAVAWARYGHRARVRRRDPLLDHYLPRYEVAERHEARVAAPAAVTWSAAMRLGLEDLRVARALIRLRERLLRARDADVWPRGGIVEQLRAWGWSVLAEVPGREIVLGTVTRPWRADVRFRPLAPAAFVAFDRPGYVKLATTIAVEPAGAGASVFRIDTRVCATDPAARARFRRYWAVFSPGVRLIRRAALRAVRRAAVRRAAATHGAARHVAAWRGAPYALRSRSTAR